MYRTTVKIEGMACGMCEAHIKDALRKLYPGASKMTASHVKKEASFVTEEAADPEKIREAVDATGYRFVSCEMAAYEKKRLFGR